jgi:transposase
MCPSSLQAQLAQFHGRATRTRHTVVPSVLMTEGVVFLAQTAGAHCLTDAIASYVHALRARKEHFQVWRLAVDTSTRTEVITMMDGDIRPLYSRSRYPISGRYTREGYVITIHETERPGAAKRQQESGIAAPGCGGRLSPQRKRDAVLRLLRSEDLHTVSRALGVTAATLSGWREAFMPAREVGVVSRPADSEEIATERLTPSLVRYCWSTNCSSRKAQSWKQATLGKVEIGAMSRTTSQSSGKPYGVVTVCWGNSAVRTSPGLGSRFALADRATPRSGIKQPHGLNRRVKRPILPNSLRGIGRGEQRGSRTERIARSAKARKRGSPIRPRSEWPTSARRTTPSSSNTTTS